MAPALDKTHVISEVSRARDKKAIGYASVGIHIPSARENGVSCVGPTSISQIPPSILEILGSSRNNEISEHIDPDAIGSDARNTLKSLWDKSGQYYSDIMAPIQDIKEANTHLSSLLVKFECQIWNVIAPAIEGLSCQDSIFNHVVLIKTSAVDGVNSDWLMEATTCREYMERRWPSVAVQLLWQVVKTCEAHFEACDLERKFKRIRFQVGDRKSTPLSYMECAVVNMLTFKKSSLPPLQFLYPSRWPFT